jgi:hypothetical protein
VILGRIMTEQNRLILEQNLREMFERKVRIDIAPDSLDPYFLTLFVLYWLASQSVATSTRLPVVKELIQAGLRAKFNREDALIREKLRTYCNVSGVEFEELLQAIKDAIGYDVSAVELDQIYPSGESFNLGKK